MANNKCPYCQDETKTFHSANETSGVFSCSMCSCEHVVSQLQITTSIHNCSDCSHSNIEDFDTVMGWINKCCNCNGYCVTLEEDGLQYPLNDQNDPESGRL